MSKSVLVIDTPENCYDCPFGTAYCGELEYEGLCELADCLDCVEILITEEHYDYESKSRPDWCPLKLLLYQRTMYYSNIVLDSQWIAKAADSTNTVQNVFKAYHVTGT